MCVCVRLRVSVLIANTCTAEGGHDLYSGIYSAVFSLKQCVCVLCEDMRVRKAFLFLFDSISDKRQGIAARFQQRLYNFHHITFIYYYEYEEKKRIDQNTKQQTNYA